jgi:hypothetical protein
MKALYKLLTFSPHYYKDKLSSDPTRAESARKYLHADAAGNQPPHADLLLEREERYRSEVQLTGEFVRLYLEKYKDKVKVVKNSVDQRRLFELLEREFRSSLGAVPAGSPDAK